MDRLPDAFWTEQELQQMAEAMIVPSRYDTTAKTICWYQLYKDGAYTGKAMVLAVDGVVDGLEAVNKVVQTVGLTAQIGEYGKESVLNNQKIQAIYLVLEPYQYASKARFVGADCVFSYESWMAKLV